jgi:hypothetical protein
MNCSIIAIVSSFDTSSGGVYVSATLSEAMSVAGKAETNFQSNRKSLAIAIAVAPWGAGKATPGSGNADPGVKTSIDQL